MSKRKLGIAAKRPRKAKMAARVQRSKQATIKSPKDDLLRSVAIGAIESPLKLQDDSRHEAPIVEKCGGDLQDDLSQKMAESNPKQEFALATANMQAPVKLLEIAQANTQFAFEFGLRLAAIRSPSDFFAVIAEFTSRRIDLYGKYMTAYPFWCIEASRALTSLPGR
ncbi:Phasin protein [Bradyrhizobium sp. USDA 4486]